MAATKLRSTTDPLHILLIEDDEGDRDLALAYLSEDRRYQYQITCAKSLEEGLGKLQSSPFDIIILDLLLPDSKGIATVSKLYAHVPNIPIIVSSYFDEDAIASRAIELGAQDYLAKDVMSSLSLSRIISRTLARAKQVTARAQQRQPIGEPYSSEPYSSELVIGEPSSDRIDPDPLSSRIQQLQTDIHRLELVASRVTQVYEDQQNVGDVRQRMVQTLSHECRTPATVILLATNILKSYSTNVADDQYMAAIARIDEAIRQMMKLLDSAMNLQKMQTIVNEELAESINLKTLCEAVIAQLSRSFPSEDLSLTRPAASRFLIQYEGDYQHVVVYRAIVEQILLQLLTNAVQYAPAATEINVTLQNSIDELIIKVEDKGSGIAKKEQPKVFEAFYRASHMGSVHGIGLGLTIVKTCVDICGGQVKLDSRLAKGTTVTVILPLDAPALLSE